jgi:N-acetyl-alpha-D-muramate 1-phosphate uridylyltransferase
MKALILAAGRGERMRPLTDHTPKPLLPVRGRPLIEWHLLALARAGVRQVVINAAWLGGHLVQQLGDGARFGLSIHWSREDLDPGHALETAGGIAKALPWLAPRPDDAFWLISGDVFMPGFDYAADVFQRFAAGSPTIDAHLWLVPNPPFHAAGDFALDAHGQVLAGDDADARAQGLPRWTYASLALVRGRLCEGLEPGTVAKLLPYLTRAMTGRRVTGEVWTGEWHNVGSAAELQQANRESGRGTNSV